MGPISAAHLEATAWALSCRLARRPRLRLPPFTSAHRHSLSPPVAEPNHLLAPRSGMEAGCLAQIRQVGGRPHPDPSGARAAVCLSPSLSYRSSSLTPSLTGRLPDPVVVHDGPSGGGSDLDDSRGGVQMELERSEAACERIEWWARAVG